jgi:hypothetical protein
MKTKLELHKCGNYYKIVMIIIHKQFSLTLATAEYLTKPEATSITIRLAIEMGWDVDLLVYDS